MEHHENRGCKDKSRKEFKFFATLFDYVQNTI